MEPEPRKPWMGETGIEQYEHDKEKRVLVKSLEKDEIHILRLLMYKVSPAFAVDIPFKVSEILETEYGYLVEGRWIKGDENEREYIRLPFDRRSLRIPYSDGPPYDSPDLLATTDAGYFLDPMF